MNVISFVDDYVIGRLVLLVVVILLYCTENLRPNLVRYLDGNPREEDVLVHKSLLRYAFAIILAAMVSRLIYLIWK